MKCAAEMGSGVMIHIPSFIKIDSGVQKLLGGVHRHRQLGDVRDSKIPAFSALMELAPS
jgi:hypothetical protein